MQKHHHGAICIDQAQRHTKARTKARIITFPARDTSTPATQNTQASCQPAAPRGRSWYIHAKENHAAWRNRSSRVHIDKTRKKAVRNDIAARALQ